MIATFFLEIFLLLYTLTYRKLGSIATRLGAVILLCLAIFQLAEFGVCESLGLSSSVWAKIGFSAITILPAVGVHLVLTLANASKRLLLPVVYSLMIGWIAVFNIGETVHSYQCGGNYLIFNITSPLGGYYALYYYLLITLGVFLSLYYAWKTKKTNIRYALLSMTVGYLVFSIPTAFITMVYQDTARAIPSIMCGFAVLFAILLAVYTLPKYEK